MRITRSIAHRILKLFQPSMYRLNKDGKGKCLSNTRVSNTTHLGSFESLILGDNVFIGHYNMIDASNGINIGEGCQLTNYISVLTHSSHIAIRLYGKEYTQQKELKAYFSDSVEIGKYTFVGPHSVIMPGARIGKGSLISAYSYVKGEFEDFAVIAGNPAKKVGDTRDIDQKYLEQYPELKPFYQAWAQ